MVTKILYISALKYSCERNARDVDLFEIRNNETISLGYLQNKFPIKIVQYESNSIFRYNLCKARFYAADL